MLSLALLFPAHAADLEGNPTFGLFPGTAGLLTRPSRLGWEAEPLVAVGASLDVGSPELDASSRGRWTRALAIALPAQVHSEASDDGELVERSSDGFLNPWVGLGLARAGDRRAFGLSLILDLDLELSPASLEGLAPVSRSGAGSITWDGDVPSRDEGASGRATGQDLDLALSTGFARVEGEARPRLDLVARWLRSGEFVRAAQGTALPTTPYSGAPPAGPSVDSLVGANTSSFWGMPNRSSVTLGAVAGLDRGGTLRDPRLRLEAGLAGGPAWPTFPDTVMVQGRYTEDLVRTSLDYGGLGLRLAGQVGATWGWVADTAGERPAVRVRSGWRLDALREDHRLETCALTCEEILDRTQYAKLTLPTALELQLSERVTAQAGLSPSAHLYRFEHRLDPEEGGLRVQDAVLGLGVRGGLRYERQGWVLGASLSGTSGVSSGSAGGFGGSGASVPLYVPPDPPRELSLAGPALSLSPLLWIGWRPS